MLKETATYHKIISAAASCFAEKGFNATSIREISIRAKISQGAMYTYFKSKENLIEAIIIEEQKTALAKHQESYSGSHFDRIIELFTSCVEEVGYPSTHQLWVEVIAESARKEELRASYVLSDKIMRKGVAEIIQRGIGNGEFSPSVNTEEATVMIFSLIDGLIGRKAMTPSFNVVAELPSLRSVFAVILKKMN